MKLAATIIVVGCMIGCASIPEGRYGIDSLTIQGVETFDEAALTACLTTRARPNATIRFRPEPICGERPFRAGRTVDLWSWPWTEWPLYDQTAFDQDLERIRRWYEARGHHDAEVTRVDLDPEQAQESARANPPECGERARDDGCELSIRIEVEEGEPTLVRSFDVEGIGELPAEVRREIEAAYEFEEQDRFDEAIYDQIKSGIVEVLAEHGYALAEVGGDVFIDRDQRVADVMIRVTPGPVCTFGALRITGHGDMDADPIRAAARLPTGDRYDSAVLGEIQRAVYDMGAFGSVVVEPIMPEEGNVIDIQMNVSMGRAQRFRFGGGLQGGVIHDRDETTIDTPQWDVHLIGNWEHRNLFGGFRRFRIEERPRMIFNDRFPRPTRPQFGNLIGIRFVQPGFIEGRTQLALDVEHDYGPDPFDEFIRHDLTAGAFLERFFWDQRIFMSVGSRGHLYRVPGNQMEEGSPLLPSDSHVMFLSQEVRLDLRDIPASPTRGFYASCVVHEAGFFMPSSWSYFRVIPDIRGYVPLGDRLVLATRFRLGMLFLREADPTLNLEERQLGPRQYRLRGGGSTSNRGFLPGDLGDGPAGGLRQWLATIELRARVTENFGIVAFADAGDVHADPTFRFDHLQLSVGLGLRYLTIVGPIRLDVGWRVPGLQVLGGIDDRSDAVLREIVDLGFASFPGAVHLTIGESF